MTIQERNAEILRSLRDMLAEEGFSPHGATAPRMLNPRTKKSISLAEHNELSEIEKSRKFFVPVAPRERFKKQGPRDACVIVTIGVKTTTIHAYGKHDIDDDRPTNAIVNSNEQDKIKESIDQLLNINGQVVTPDRFGASHYNLLAKLVSRCYEQQADTIKFSRAWIRSNKAKHYHLSRKGENWWNGNGTQLLGCEAFNPSQNPQPAIDAGVLLPRHDDWDCLQDLEAAGMIRIESLEKAKITMLEPGYQAIEALTEEHTSEQNDFPEALSPP